MLLLLICVVITMLEGACVVGAVELASHGDPTLCQRHGGDEGQDRDQAVHSTAGF